MGFLDAAGLDHFWNKVTSALAGKQNTITTGDGLNKEGDTLSVTTPVRGIFTRAEFDALPEEQRNKGLSVILGGEDGGGGGGIGGIPKGVIWIWSGAVEDIPDGWALCDGQNGTMDLRDRFVLGGGGTHPVGETGGEETHTLTVEEMPEHNHSMFIVASESGGSYNAFSPKANYHANAKQTTYTGGSQPHSNMPPYYVLCYIMKL